MEKAVVAVESFYSPRNAGIFLPKNTVCTIRLKTNIDASSVFVYNSIMDLKEIITQKRSMLEMAREKVADLERQIQALESVAKTDDFDLLLASKIRQPTAEALSQALKPVQVEKIANQSDGLTVGSLSPTAKGRNPKGVTRKMLLEALTDGQLRDLDFLAEEVNKRLPNPMTRPALRTALMYMRENGEVISPKAGYFRLPHKSENPAGTGLSGATMSEQDDLGKEVTK